MLAQTTTVKFNSEDASMWDHHYKRYLNKGFELTGGIGVAIMNSDNESRPFRDNGLRPIRNNGYGLHLDAGALYNFNPYIGILGNLGYNTFKGDEDAEYSKDDVTYNSKALRLEASLLVNLINPYAGVGRYRHRRFVVPYIKAGVGTGFYTSSSYSNDKNGDANNLDNSAASTGMMALLPIGGGLRFYVHNNFCIAPELSLIFSSTDYLDSRAWEPGILGENDHFATASVKFFYQLKPVKRVPVFIRP
ncbi:porin family protein [Pontibacter sp. CAU 1760]